MPTNGTQSGSGELSAIGQEFQQIIQQILDKIKEVEGWLKQQNIKLVIDIGHGESAIQSQLQNLSKSAQHCYDYITGDTGQAHQLVDQWAQVNVSLERIVEKVKSKQSGWLEQYWTGDSADEFSAYLGNLSDAIAAGADYTDKMGEQVNNIAGALDTLKSRLGTDVRAVVLALVKMINDVNGMVTEQLDQLGGPDILLEVLSGVATLGGSDLLEIINACTQVCTTIVDGLLDVGGKINDPLLSDVEKQLNAIDEAAGEIQYKAIELAGHEPVPGGDISDPHGWTPKQQTSA